MNKTIFLISSLLFLQFPSIAVGTSANLLAKASSQQTICQIESEEEFLSPQEMQTLANKITVKVTGDNNGGSGTLLAKQGNSYLVLTNAHVVRGVNKINLKTFDGKEYPAEIVPQSKFEKSDLALLKFQTSQSYCVPEIAESISGITGWQVIAAGYSADKGKIVFRTGEVTQITGQPLKEGYQIGYSSDIDQGMSGGAIISSDGSLIGINGRSAYPILNTGYVYENGKKPTDEEIQEMRKVSLGIPISTLLKQVNTDTRTAYKLPLPPNEPSVPKIQVEPKGWLGELEQKAKQFTVRIDSNSGANGSGIIIAEEGDTYTVLTAAHVVCEKEAGTKPCKNYSYEILAPDGQKYPVEKSTVKTEEGVDLGILKFTAKNQNYQVATLADYNPNDFEYVFAAGYPKLGNQSPWRFSLGLIFDKERGLLATRQSDFQINSDGQSQTASFLTGGYELVYTSITYSGMSGGPVLDSQGRVIGIHGRAEGEQAIDQKIGDCGVNEGCKIQLGYSLGIPVSTFLGLTTRFGVQAQKVEENIQAPQLTTQQAESIEDAVLSADVSTGNAQASVWLERGNQLWRLRRYKEAVKAFDRAIKQKPAFIYLAYYGKGLALFWDGKLKESVTVLEKAVKLKPDFVAAWQNLALSYRGWRPKKALVALNKAIQLQQENPNLYNEKSAILTNLRRYAEAEIAINKAICIAPRSIFYSNRGVMYTHRKKWELALSDYSKAIQINPKDAVVYYNRGIVYADQKKWDLAIADYNKAIQINPKYVKTYINRGSLYYKRKKGDLAIADYSKAIQINPNIVIVYINRGSLYYKQKKWDLAIADYSKVIQINPKYVDAYNNRGNVYAEQKKWELALVDYNKAMQINSNNALTYNNRGNVYKNQKKWELALADYNQAIQINRNDAKVYYNRGVLYAEQKKWELALVDFSKAIKINPNDVDAYVFRGLVYLQKGDKQKAIEDLQQAAQIFQAQGNIDAYENTMNLLKELQE